MDVFRGVRNFFRKSESSIRQNLRAIVGTKLDLRNCDVETDLKLQRTLESLQGKENVTTIYLSGTNVTTIPAAIGAFSNLREIHFSGNQIQFLPWSIILLKQLEILDLSQNNISSIPTILCYLPKLKELNMSKNELTKLPTELMNLPNIESFDFSENAKLASPPLAVCRQGKEAIFSALEKRLRRKNLWEKWKPYYQEQGSVRLNTLMEICIECILNSDVDFLAASHIPPVMKNYLTEVEKMEQFGLIPRLHKCSNCQRYFTTNATFENHSC